MKKAKKHLKALTTDEAISHIFHPKALEHLKKHLEALSRKKKKPTKQES